MFYTNHYYVEIESTGDVLAICCTIEEAEAIVDEYIINDEYYQPDYYAVRNIDTDEIVLVK